MVDEVPLSDGTLDLFFRNRFDADAAMAGMYGAFQTTMIGESQFNNRITYWGDARADNMMNNIQNNISNEIHFNSLTPSNTYADWGPLYTIIGRANLNIAKFPEINNYAKVAERISDATLNSYLAQCHAMRAMCYFYILRVWGDAPIWTTPYLNVSENPARPRAPKTEVRAQIIADLEKAYALTAKGATSNAWYIGEGAIAAMLADVYMWRSHDDAIMPDYANAITWFKNVFKAKGPTGRVYNASGTVATGSGGAAADLASTADWKLIFTNPAANLESIWVIHWDVAANGCPCMMGVSTTVNLSSMRTDRVLYTGAASWLRAGLDTRAKQSIDSSKSDNFDRVLKWYGPSGYTNARSTYMTRSQADAAVGINKPVYIPVYRISDVFLLYAEALNKTGDRANALRYLNLVRQRATLAPYTAAQLTTEDQMEDALLAERRSELFAEGKRWFDLVRTHKVAQYMDQMLRERQLAAGSAQTGWGTDKRRYLWPLHRNVLNANPSLVQNPPYSE
ncbi:RagB/SusD family nutrient uptake outer membrane protein [Flaviaesturariibacter amylovorans]|uniref:RagB/SusD family nutrient uptake outer membrane protein n=2 Tax=Flaviaesturariibacter amylovorans TaxID=1084520 RepID=A0ABP8H6N1_9BACT